MFLRCDVVNTCNREFTHEPHAYFYAGKHYSCDGSAVVWINAHRNANQRRMGMSVDAGSARTEFGVINAQQLSLGKPAAMNTPTLIFWIDQQLLDTAGVRT